MNRFTRACAALLTIAGMALVGCEKAAETSGTAGGAGGSSKKLVLGIVAKS